ncbi:MAG TPA: hypothetical protein VGF50_04875 [Caulobacteraceae bacterium]|jgi:hypothetical protein
MTGPAVRHATLADAPALATLFVEARRDEHAGLLPEEILAGEHETPSPLAGEGGREAVG